ncbi:unnamed protein product, partial [Staurois parvus]
MVRVTSQGSEQVASSVVQRVRQRDGQGHKPGIRTETGYRAQDKHNTKAESVGLA